VGVTLGCKSGSYGKTRYIFVHLEYILQRIQESDFKVNQITLQNMRSQGGTGLFLILLGHMVTRLVEGDVEYHDLLGMSPGENFEHRAPRALSYTDISMNSFSACADGLWDQTLRIQKNSSYFVVPIRQTSFRRIRSEITK